MGGELYQGRIQEGVEITISGTDTRRGGDNYIRDGHKKGGGRTILGRDNYI